MDDLIHFRSPARSLGHPTVLRAETASTNDDARALAAQGAPHGALALADAQRSGRGRRGRTWSSPPGDNLYASFVLRPQVTLAEAPSLTLVAGLAVAEAVAIWCPGVEIRVKWPNDVRAEDRKIAGVLVEASLRDDTLAWVVLGVGINVRGAAPPAGLEDIATTLRRLRGGADLSRSDVLATLCERLEARLDEHARGGFEAIRGALTARCETLGRRVRIEEIEGVAESIGDDGALMVRDDDGRLLAVRSGEIA